MKIRILQCDGLPEVRIGRLSISFVGWGSLIASLGCGNVYGAEAQSLDEIVVTAQRREESVQDVPISITVVSREYFARQGLQTVQDLGKVSASLEFTFEDLGPGGGGFMRGIGFSSLGAGTAQSSVSLVLDGVVLGNVPVKDLHDIERIEILKGPQGTLFGASVSSGVVSVTTLAPDPSRASLDLSAELATSKYERSAIRLAGNLPTGGRSALRIAAHAYANSGLSTNIHTDTESKYYSSGFRLRYMNELSDRLTLNLIADYNKSDEMDHLLTAYRFAPAGSALAGALNECGITASRKNVDFCSGQEKYRDIAVGGASAQFDWTMGPLIGTSITSYRRFELEQANDLLNTPQEIMARWFTESNGCTFAAMPCSLAQRISPGYSTAPHTGESDILTQELRLTSPSDGNVEWIAGLFYSDFERSGELPFWITISVETPDPCTSIGAGIVEGPSACRVSNQIRRSGSRIRDKGLFSNFTFNLADTSRLIAGVRYTRSTVSHAEFDRSPIVNPATKLISLAVGADEVTWRLGYQRDFGENAMLYATAATGYKSPQVNSRGTQQIFAIAPETPLSFEIGIKSAVADGRLGVNANAFYMDIEDYQGQNCVPVGLGFIDCQTVNIPRVESRGLELEIFGQPTSNVSLNLSAIYNIAEYPENYFDEFGAEISGQQLAYAPKFKVTLSGEYSYPLTDRLSLTVGADATVRDEQLMYIAASRPEFVAPQTSLVNARIGIRHASDWAVSLFGRNLGNKIYPNSYTPTSGFQQGGVLQTFDFQSKRLVGLQFEANF